VTERWAAAGRALLARAIGEFAYEEIVEPVRDGEGGRWSLRLPDGVTYAFSAARGGFGAWRGRSRLGHPGRRAGRGPRSGFLLDVRARLGLRGTALGEAVRDLIATHTADARLLAAAVTAAALADLSWVDLEAHQGGHPVPGAEQGPAGVLRCRRRAVHPEPAAT
jgi:siderophore synthetase component